MGIDAMTIKQILMTNESFDNRLLALSTDGKLYELNRDKGPFGEWDCISNGLEKSFAESSCIEIYEDYDGEEIARCSKSIQRAWMVGRDLKHAGA